MTSVVAPLIFISYAEEDNETATALAKGLEEKGFKTWYYTRDGVPGEPHFVQTGTVIEGSAACILLISAHALKSGAIAKELEIALNNNRPLVPLLIGVTDAEYKQRAPVFRHAVGAIISIPIPKSGVTSVLDKIVAGLRARSIVPPVPTASLPFTSSLQHELGNALSIKGRGTIFEPPLSDWNKPSIGRLSNAFTLRTIPASDLIYLSSFTAARLDWHLDGIKRGDGFLTRTEVEELARLLQRQIDRELASGDDARFLRQDLQLVERIQQDMVAKDIDSLDYLPDQFRALPERLRPYACELWMVHGKPDDMQGKDVITQRTIDRALRSSASRGDSYKLDDFREVAKHLGFLP